jgi:hypothetical protein
MIPLRMYRDRPDEFAAPRAHTVHLPDDFVPGFHIGRHMRGILTQTGHIRLDAR